MHYAAISNKVTEKMYYFVAKTIFPLRVCPIWTLNAILQNAISNIRNDLMTKRYELVWEAEEMPHHGKHAPASTILRPVAGIKFEMSLFCA